MIRLFVSVELPEDVKQTLQRVCCDVPGARWLEPDEMHLTLRFIGEVDGLVFRDVADSLDEVRAAPFPLAIRGVGHFPPRGDPHVLWAGVEKSDALVDLRNRVEAAVVRAGVAPEGRKFSPHVTLARLKNAPQRAVGSFLSMNGLLGCDPFTVRDFHLFSSQLSAKRAVHRCEASYELAGGEGR